MWTLKSYEVPLSYIPSTPEAMDQSVTSPPKEGVKPPGKTWLKTKQLGSFSYTASASPIRLYAVASISEGQVLAPPAAWPAF